MIPKIIHFVYGLEEGFGGKEFGFAHWAAIRSASKMNPDYKLIYWYAHLPDNYYFDDVKPLLELRKITPPTEIFGNPLLHVAHKTDVVRLNALIECGGIYLDIDTVTTKSFDNLLEHKCVMGYENVEGITHGICNAIMLSEINSEFMSSWLLEFKSFRSKGRDQYWAEHAVTVPLRLAKSIPESITILDEKAFFYPGWTDEGLIEMFYENKKFPEAYAHHLWESRSWGALKSFNEFNSDKIQCSYTSILNEVLKDEIGSLAKKRSAWANIQLENKNACLNIGCGPNRDIDHINCDMYPQTGAELIFDISKPNWPIPDNSVSSVKLFHVLEHLPGDFQIFFQELYRVCKSDANIYIRVPHPRHDWFLIDPTHVKPWHEESFSYLDKSVSLKRYFSGDSKTPLALYWNIDFETTDLQLFTETTETEFVTKSIIQTNASGNDLKKYLNNYIAEIRVTLKCKK
jgi:SAM-dependent methyltransferase